MTADMKRFVDACLICQQNKVRREKELGSLSITGPVTEPLEIVSIDTVGGLEGYGSSSKYLHLAIDHLSRFVWASASKTQKAHDFISLVRTICHIRVPKLILTDRYPGIKCKTFEDFLERQGIDVKYIFTQCPHSNGIVERVNQTLINKLRCAYNEADQRLSWDRLLQEIVAKYNDTLHSTTGYSPRFLLLGSCLRIAPIPSLLASVRR